jgi:hypothetical protein
MKYCRHPYYPARYAALAADRVRVEAETGDWGEFDRNAVWLEGPLRHADPVWCRWVTSEIAASQALAGDA